MFFLVGPSEMLKQNLLMATAAEQGEEPTLIYLAQASSEVEAHCACKPWSTLSIDYVTPISKLNGTIFCNQHLKSDSALLKD